MGANIKIWGHHFWGRDIHHLGGWGNDMIISFNSRRLHRLPGPLHEICVITGDMGSHIISSIWDNAGKYRILLIGGPLHYSVFIPRFSNTVPALSRIHIAIKYGPCIKSALMQARIDHVSSRIIIHQSVPFNRLYLRKRYPVFLIIQLCATFKHRPGELFY